MSWIALPWMQMADAERLGRAGEQLAIRKPQERAPVEGLDRQPTRLSDECGRIDHGEFSDKNVNH